jgi:hypothetical protein
MWPPSYMWSVIDWNIVMWHMTVSAVGFLIQICSSAIYTATSTRLTCFSCTCLIHNYSLINLLVVHFSRVVSQYMLFVIPFQQCCFTVYVVRYPISEFCKSKDASYNVAELPSWHKFIVQRRIVAPFLKDDPGVRREGRRSARHDISRTGILIQSLYNVHSVWEVSWLDQSAGRQHLLNFVTFVFCLKDELSL